jgi:hypothetical protein
MRAIAICIREVPVEGDGISLLQPLKAGAKCDDVIHVAPHAQRRIKAHVSLGEFSRQILADAQMETRVLRREGAEQRALVRVKERSLAGLAVYCLRNVPKLLEAAQDAASPNIFLKASRHW